MSEDAKKKRGQDPLPGSYILAPDYERMYNQLLSDPTPNLALVVGGVRRVSNLVHHAMSMVTVIRSIRAEQNGGNPHGEINIRKIKNRGLRKVLLRLKDRGIDPDIFEKMVEEGSIRAASMSPSSNWTHKKLTESFGGGRYNITTTPGKKGSSAFAERAEF